jgi:hypothetical protein
MEFELRAGAKLDLLSPKDLDKVLDRIQGWVLDDLRGVQPTDLTAVGTTIGATIVVDPEAAPNNTGGPLGPGQGFYWAIRSIVVTGPAVATDAVHLYKNSVDALHIRRPFLTGAAGATGYASFGTNELLLKPGERLIVAGAVAAGAGAPITVTVTGAAIEVPSHLLARMLL